MGNTDDNDTMSWILNQYRTLPHSWVTEVRDPLLIFGDEKYGFYMMSFGCWNEVLAVSAVNIFLAYCCAIIIYKYIIQPQQINKQSSTFSYLLGYGVILPFWYVYPKLFITFAEIDNAMMRMVACITPVLCFFKAIEAIHGTYEPHAAKSLRSYLFYYTCPLIALYDKKNNRYIKCSKKQMVQHLLLYITYLSIAGILHSSSLLFPNYLPQFGVEYDDSEIPWYHWSRMFQWQALASTLYYASFFQLYLASFSQGFHLLLCVLTGLDFESGMDNPLLESKSIAEFWGKRWNMLIHRCLQRGVYRPVRKIVNSKYIPMLAAFVMSGLLHEWLLFVLFLDRTTGGVNNSNGSIILGTQSIFFVWQAFLMGLQFFLGKFPAMQKLGTSVPYPLNTLLVLVLGGCAGYFFVEPYVRGNYFDHGMLFFPVLKPIV